MPKAIFCVALNETQAELIVNHLREAGLSPGDSTAPLLGPPSELPPTRRAAKAPEGAASGARTGCILGSVFGIGASFGWLAGNGAFALPDLVPLLAASPVFSGISSALAGAAIGSAAGWLIGLGIQREQSEPDSPQKASSSVPDDYIVERAP